MEHTKL
ncbi:hypothetical protein LINPERPRIM_LOCUS41177 [Linum perenne]